MADAKATGRPGPPGCALVRAGAPHPLLPSPSQPWPLRPADLWGRRGWEERPPRTTPRCKLRRQARAGGCPGLSRTGLVLGGSGQVQAGRGVAVGTRGSAASWPESNGTPQGPAPTLTHHYERVVDTEAPEAIGGLAHVGTSVLRFHLLHLQPLGQHAEAAPAAVDRPAVLGPHGQWRRVPLHGALQPDRAAQPGHLPRDHLVRHPRRPWGVRGLHQGGGDWQRVGQGKGGVGTGSWGEACPCQ